MTKRSESEARRHSVQAPLGQRVVSAAMSALLVFSMWPTGATRVLAEAIAPQDTQEVAEEVYESGAPEQAVAEDTGANGAQAADEVQAAAEAEAAAAAEAERAAAERAAADQAAADQAAAEQAAAEQAAAEQAAAEAEANRQVNVGIDVPNATLHYNGQAFTAPTESITVPVHAAFVFGVAPMAGYNLKAVKTLVNGQETELHADAQGLYTVSEATLDSNVTVKVVTEPTPQPEPTVVPEVPEVPAPGAVIEDAPAGDVSDNQGISGAPADEPKAEGSAVDAAAPGQGDVTVAENPADDADINVSAVVAEKTITVGETITLTSKQTGGWYTHTWSTTNPGVAEVSNADSETVTVTGVAPGTATIADEYTPLFGTASRRISILSATAPVA